MKKILLLVTLASLFISSLFASEPLVLASLSSPALFSGFYPAGIALSASELYSDEAFMLTLSERIMKEGLKLDDALSLNPIRSGAFLWKMFAIYQDYRNFEYIAGEGDIKYSFGALCEEGSASIGITYDGVSLFYSDGRASLDGNVNVRFSFFTDSILDILIETEGICISGSPFADSSLLIRIYLNRDGLKSYLTANGIDLSPYKDALISTFLNSPLALQYGLSQASTRLDVDAFLSENDAQDLLDACAFFLCSEEMDISPLNAISIAAEIVLCTDERDINISRVLNAVNAVTEIIRGTRSLTFPAFLGQRK